MSGKLSPCLFAFPFHHFSLFAFPAKVCSRPASLAPASDDGRTHLNTALHVPYPGSGCMHRDEHPVVPRARQKELDLLASRQQSWNCGLALPITGCRGLCRGGACCHYSRLGRASSRHFLTSRKSRVAGGGIGDFAFSHLIQIHMAGDCMSHPLHRIRFPSCLIRPSSRHSLSIPSTCIRVHSLPDFTILTCRANRL